VIVTYLPYADIIGRFSAGSVPVISAQRSSLHKRGYVRWPEKLTSKLVTEYIIQTEAARQWVWSRKVTIIPNAVELIQLRRTTPYTLPPTPLQIICVSNLRPEKHLDVLLRAIAESRISSCELRIVGAGPKRRGLESLTDKLGITKQVEFLGSRDDVPALLNQSDIFVHPSPAEGMSNAILEAMSAGSPVIAADIPANYDREFLRIQGVACALYLYFIANMDLKQAAWMGRAVSANWIREVNSEMARRLQRINLCGARQEKIDLIWDAADYMGYRIDVGTAQIMSIAGLFEGNRKNICRKSLKTEVLTGFLKTLVYERSQNTAQ